MQRSVALLYFSGTGNTEALARIFQQEFLNRNCITHLIRMEDVLKKEISFDPSGYEFLGFGYPVHGFGPPRIVDQFLKKMPPAENLKTFVFKSPADFFWDGGTNYFLRKELGKKGYRVIHESTLVMPANLAIRYPDALIKELYLDAEKRIRQIVEDILSNKTSLQKRRYFLDGLSWLINWSAVKSLPLFGPMIYASRACNTCGLCIKKCPTGNITRNKNSVKFGWKCSFCMRCFYLCPEKAVRHWMGSIVLKNWYDLDKIVKDRRIPGTYVTPDTKGYYRRFYHYFHDKT